MAEFCAALGFDERSVALAAEALRRDGSENNRNAKPGQAPCSLRFIQYNSITIFRVCSCLHIPTFLIIMYVQDHTCIAILTHIVPPSSTSQPPVSVYLYFGSFWHSHVTVVRRRVLNVPNIPKRFSAMPITCRSISQLDGALQVLLDRVRISVLEAEGWVCSGSATALGSQTCRISLYPSADVWNNSYDPKPTFLLHRFGASVREGLFRVFGNVVEINSLIMRPWGATRFFGMIEETKTLSIHPNESTIDLRYVSLSSNIQIQFSNSVHIIVYQKLAKTL